jgi:hypothetical protein
MASALGEGTGEGDAVLCGDGEGDAVAGAGGDELA